MKKIALTQRLIENGSYYEIRECLDVNYPKLIEACGFLPIILPYEIDFENYFKNIGIDGVILTGGNDLYSCNKNELSKKRDKFEKKLLQYCMKNNITVFGICRGMQVIAEYFGSAFNKVDNQKNIKHTLKININSKYNKELEKLKAVNSYHNFVIDKLSEQFIISATNEYNVIKAIEHKEYKIFAQMWHSERESPFIKDEIALIKKIFNQ